MDLYLFHIVAATYRAASDRNVFTKEGKIVASTPTVYHVQRAVCCVEKARHCPALCSI